MKLSSCIELKFYSALFFIAGLIHFIFPQWFYPAVFPFLKPYAWEIIIMTGIIEWVLALGLIMKSTKVFFAKLSGLYLLLLIPVHVYVSWYEIKIFGINNQILLWARTLFQFILIIPLILHSKSNKL